MTASTSRTVTIIACRSLNISSNHEDDIQTGRYRIASEGWLVPFLFVLSVVFLTLSSYADSVVNSVHNLSVAGPGTVKATAERTPVSSVIRCIAPMRTAIVEPSDVQRDQLHRLHEPHPESGGGTTGWFVAPLFELP